MRRRTLLALGALSLPAATVAEAPLVLGPGPHLFLDDWLPAELDGLRRRRTIPRRHGPPVLTSAEFGVTQPYLGAARDGTSGLRLWYNRGPAIWTTASEDGIRWGVPREAWAIARGYGCSVLDDRERESDPTERFKAATWQSTRERDDSPADDGGLWVGFSPDGLRWRGYPGNPVLRTYPGGYPHFHRHGVGDTVDCFYDPIRGRYGCAVKLHALPEDGYAPAPKAGRAIRRLVGVSYSRDFLRWTRPERIHAPDACDEGLLEFYGMGAVHARGPLLIGLLRVLRDDLPCEPGGPTDGIGYTVLAWSRDGIAWTRDREPFLDRSPEPGAWDRAMAWGSAVVPRGEQLFLYYGGYARGHKVAPDRERQVGLAILPRDRYAGLEAGSAGGRLVTKPFLHPGGALRVNLDASAGEARVRFLDASGRPGEWSSPLLGDLRDRDPGLGALKAGQLVRLELRLTRAVLYAIRFGDDAEP